MEKIEIQEEFRIPGTDILVEKGDVISLDEVDVHRVLGFSGEDNVGNFWVVTYPTPRSTFQDILFQTDVIGMVLQFRGGLDGSEIALITFDGREAEQKAKYLITNR